MIKPILNIANMCYKCPWFKADVEMNKHYDGVKYADTDIHIFCKHKNLCDHIKSFLKDELTPEEPNTCETDEVIKNCVRCNHWVMSDDFIKCNTCENQNNWELAEDWKND